MPGFVHISRDALAALWIADNEAIFGTVLVDPGTFVRVRKGHINGVEVKGKTCLVLGMSRAGGISVSV